MDGGIIFILTLFVFAIFFSCWVLLETYKIENGLSFWNHLKIKHFLRKNEDIAKLIIKLSKLYNIARNVTTRIISYNERIKRGRGRWDITHLVKRVEELEQTENRLNEKINEISKRLAEVEKTFPIYAKYPRHTELVARSM